MYFSDFKLEAVNTVKRFSNFGFPYVIAPAFSTPAFSTPAIYSRILHSCIFHSRIFSAPITITITILHEGETDMMRLRCNPSALVNLFLPQQSD